MPFVSSSSSSSNYATDYPLCLGEVLKYYQDVVNSVFNTGIDCNGCMGFYSDETLHTKVPHYYLSHPPSMYKDAYVRLLMSGSRSKSSDTDAVTSASAGRNSIYPEGYHYTLFSHIFDLFDYKHWIGPMKQYMISVTSAYNLPGNLLGHVSASQLHGNVMYSYSLWKHTSYMQKQQDMDKPGDIALVQDNTKLITHDLFDLPTISNLSDAQARVGIFLEANRNVRQLLAKFYEKESSLRSDVSRDSGSDRGIGEVNTLQSFIEFCEESSLSSPSEISDFISFFSTLFNIEATIQLDASWINTYLIIGSLKPHIPGSLLIEEDNLFCIAARQVLPRLFSVLINCSSYSITSEIVTETTQEGTCLLHQNTCDENSKTIDLVRNQLTKLYLDEDLAGVSIDYFIYMSIPFSPPGEGWLRSTIYSFMFSESVSGYGARVIPGLENILSTTDTSQQIASSSIDLSAAIALTRSFLSTLTINKHGYETNQHHHDIVNLVFRSNYSHYLNNMALYKSLSRLGLLKAFNGSSLSANFATQNYGDKILLGNDNPQLFDALADSITDRFWIDENLAIANNIVKVNMDNKRKHHPSKTRIAYITAIYGNYESSCKRHAYQTISADFICFTDNPSIVSNNWIVDTTPYHLQFWEEQVASDFSYFANTRNISKTEILSAKNAFSNNMHPFNVAKFYKTNFPWIPRLKDYDIIVWLDGTLVIHNSMVSSRVQQLIDKNEENFIIFEVRRWGKLKNEAEMSLLSEKYTTDSWNGVKQTIQDVDKQYDAYTLSGYDDNDYWGTGRSFENTHGSKLTKGQISFRPQRGVFCTCFVAYDMRKRESQEFLALWYEHILFFSTQDQVSFPYVAQKLGAKVYSLPDDYVVAGDFDLNEWFDKLAHGL